MSELDEQIQNRRDKRDALAAAGIPTYPQRFEWDLEPSGVHAAYGEKTAEELEAAAIRLRVPGRVMAIREHGKSAFLDLLDGRVKLQLFVKKDRLSETSRTILENLDLGDQIGAAGNLIRTRAGELSLMVDELSFLSKALRPLPEKWHGLADVETRYRQRYLDLATNPESRAVFELRAAIVRGIRTFLDARGFLEVETPMMHAIPGGAAARPFVTHHNALDVDLYLRVAPELFLKRLLVGGIPRVYEINRNFRNEGISTRHNPEFTMLEFYQAYARAETLMELTEELFSRMAVEVTGAEETAWDGNALSWKAPFARFTMREAVVEFSKGHPGGPVHPEELDSADALLSAAVRVGAERPNRFRGQKGKLLAEVFETVAEDHLVQPTFIHEFPTEISPLSKQNPADPEWVERFELYAGGMEIANGFSELNDPEEQARRFREQMEAKAGGDVEAMPYDQDYVEALEYGLPPTAGEGIGVDRVTMLFSDRRSIRDVILFPLMRPR